MYLRRLSLYGADVRAKVIRYAISGIVLSALAVFLSPQSFLAQANASCGSYKIAFQYSHDKRPNPDALLEYKRGTPTALSQAASSLLEWKRGTPTALSQINGAKLALSKFKTANPSVSVSGTLALFDDNFDTATAKTQAESIVADGCFLAVIGPTSSHVAKTVIPIYAAAGIPVISPSAVDASLSGANSTFHRAVLADDTSDFRLIKTLAGLGVTKPAIFEDDEVYSSQLDRWATDSTAIAQSILEWKRGTPTVTMRVPMIDRLKAKGANGYVYNANDMELYQYPWQFASELNAACPTCKAPIFGPRTGLLNFDLKYISGTGVTGMESATLISEVAPIQWLAPTITTEYEAMFGLSPSAYASEAYDSMMFVLEGIKAGNTTPSNLNTFLNTKKYNGISGPISFDSKGELVGRSQLVFVSRNDAAVYVSGFPAGYVANGAISSSSVTTQLTAFNIAVKDFNDSATAAAINVSNGENFVYETITATTGTVTLSLPNGTHKVSVTSIGKNEVGTRRTQYVVTVTSGSITSVVRNGSSSNIVAVSGVYPLKMANPNLIVKVGASGDFEGAWFSLARHYSGVLNTMWDGISGYFNSLGEVYVTGFPRSDYEYGISFNTSKDSRYAGYVFSKLALGAPGDQPTVLTVTPPLAAISGSVSGAFGADTRVYLQYQLKGRWYGSQNRTVDSAGKFGLESMSMVGMPWRILAISRVGSSANGVAYSESFTVLSETESKTGISVVVRSPNVNGNVSIEGTAVGKVRFSVHSQSGSYARVLAGQTDASGTFSWSLPQDTYTVIFYSDDNQRFRATKMQCIAPATGAVQCNVVLTGPTASGTISGITGYTSGYITLVYRSGATTWSPKMQYDRAQIGADMKYNFFAAPGTYRMQVHAKIDGKLQVIWGPECVIPSGSKGLCNATFGNDNFKFIVKKFDGSTFSGGVGTTLSLNPTTNSGLDAQSYFVAQADEEIHLPLIDGEYTLRLRPTAGDNNAGVTRILNLTVTSGVVSDLTPSDTSTVITDVGGVYTIKLGKPVISGHAYLADGVTPATGLVVYVGEPGINEILLATTDKTGGFVLAPNSNLSNGIVKIWAAHHLKMIPVGFSGETNVETVTIVSGFGPMNLSLRMKPANLSGQVVGPLGVAAGATVQLYDDSPTSKGYKRAVQADSEGKFAFSVAPGNYRITSGANKSVGGTEGSQSCVVTSDTATLCSINLPPPNVTASVTSTGTKIQIYNYTLRYVGQDKSRFGADYYLQSTGEVGQYSGKIPSGEYLPIVMVYRNSVINFAPGPICTVPESGSVACNISLGANNFIFKALNPSGTTALTDIDYTLTAITTNGQIDTGIMYSKKFGNISTIPFYLVNGSYKLKLGPGTNTSAGVSTYYLFDVVNGEVANMRQEGTTSLITAVNGEFLLKLKSPAIAGRAVGADGSSGVPYTQVIATLGNEQFNAYTDASGYFGFNLGSTIKDGTYKVRVRANDSGVLWADSDNQDVVVASGVGPANLVIALTSPNLLSTVTGPLGISKYNMITLRKMTSNKGYEIPQWGWRQTNIEGKVGFRVEPGTYQLVANGDFDYAGGGAASSAICEVIQGQTTTCNITLPAPNVSGTLRVGGVAVQANVEFMQEPTSTSNREYSYTGFYFATKWNGYFGATLAPGTYRPRFYIYQTNTSVIGERCVVPATGSANCNFNLPATNFTFKVASSTGSIQTSGTYAYYEANYSEGRMWGGSLNTKSNNPGVYSVGLVDGTYTFTVSPEGNSRLGTPKAYVVTVETGTVTSVRAYGSTLNMNSMAGVYTLGLAGAVLSGTVVAPDGTTPVPKAEIGLFDSTKICAWCEMNYTGTDSTGYFGFGAMADGSYSIYSKAPENDVTKANSALTTVTVTNGQGPTDVVLALRTPNVTGVVRGPKGVSTNNYIEIRRMRTDGGWDHLPGLYWQRTNSEGSFGMWLEAGTYTLLAQSDLYGSGGTGTTRSCVVPASGVVSCDITLATSNLKIAIVDSVNNQIISNSWAYAYYVGGSISQVRDAYPRFGEDATSTRQIFLEDGTWAIHVEPGSTQLYAPNDFQVTVLNGAVTKVEASNGETITATSGVFRLPAKSTNLRGTLLFNSETYTVATLVDLGRWNGKYWEKFGARWIYEGRFGFSVAPGTYQITADPERRGEGGPVRSVANCVVATSGISTCNVTLTTGNLNGIIVDEYGQAYRQSYATLFTIQNGERVDGQGIRVTDAAFSANLGDGSYDISVDPYWEKRATYTTRTYRVTVGSGSIVEIKDNLSGETLTAVAGVYKFKLGTPSVKGRVLLPGSSTTGISDVEIRVSEFGSSNIWKYSTTTDRDGYFALTIPNGTFVVQAAPYGSGFKFGKSETQTIVVNNASASLQLTLRLRNPNLTGRVVTPGANPAPLANVNVNIWVDDEYFWGWTDTEGRFGVYVEKNSPNCPSKCFLTLNYGNSTEYTYKQYSISAIGDLGDKAMGGVTSRVTVLLPQSNGKTSPNKYGWVSVEEIDSVTSYSSWVSGGNTNEIGKIGLNLEQGKKYRVIFYPGQDAVGFFSPKTWIINSFSNIANETATITFDLPNLNLKVTRLSGAVSPYSWFKLSKKDGSGNYQGHSGGYVNDQGLGALTLEDGEYKLLMFPGKSGGVQREITFTISGASITGSEITGSTANIVLPNGNISGYVRNSTGLGIKAVVITAIKVSDGTPGTSVVTDTNGYYEFNLDRSIAWELRAIDPVTLGFNTLTIATASPSNAALSNQNMVITSP